MARTKEFARFDDTMTKLLSVSHDQLKVKLDAEKAVKKAKKRKSKTSASREPAAREGT